MQFHGTAKLYQEAGEPHEVPMIMQAMTNGRTTKEQPILIMH